MDKDIIIDLKNITKIYGDNVVLDNLNLYIRKNMGLRMYKISLNNNKNII